MVILKELIFKFHHWEVVVVLKRTDFNSFSCGAGLVVLKELIFTVDTFGGCGHLERTDF